MDTVWFLSTFLLTLIPLTWIAIKLTGKHPRSYPVLKSDQLVQYRGEYVTIFELASKYKPEIYYASEYCPPHPRLVWYQVPASTDNYLPIIYHLAWYDERHPHRLFNIIYRLYRQARYGSKEDIEYIEIIVDPKKGLIARARFETAGPSAVYNEVYPHLNAFIERQDGRGFLLIEDPSTQSVIEERVVNEEDWLTKEGRLKLAVQTWNHVYHLKPKDQELKIVDTPLQWMDGKTYKHYKLARRSQGDYATVDSSRIIILLTVVLFIFTSCMLKYICGDI